MKFGLHESLGNTHSPDLRDLMTSDSEFQLVAFCTSRTCNYHARGKSQSHASKTIKHVSTTTKECPDCKQFLFWKRQKI